MSLYNLYIIMAKIWGSSTWLFFHSFAEHISDTCYQKNKENICSLIRSVCMNLPCHECTKHAKQYVKYSLSPRFIKTKDELKYYLFQFHNSVNIRLNKKQFQDYDKYKKSKLEPIFKNFSFYYAKNYNPIRGFQDTLNRINIINNIKHFLIQNKHQIRWI